MKIKIVVIDFETPKWLRKAIAYGAPIVGVLVVAGVAIAMPVTWKTNDPLTAVGLNGMNRVTHGSTSYSVGATSFCGLSSTPTMGNIFSGSLPGYAGAKAMCEASPGCNSPTAHMCTGEELVRSQSIGIMVSQQGWYSTGVHAELEGGTSLTVDDCQGWTTTTSSFGPAWGGPSPGPNSPGTRGCGIPLPVLCCD